MARPLHTRSLALAAVLLTLAVAVAAPSTSADPAGPAQAGGTCPASVQRDHMASTPQQIEALRRRILSESPPGQQIVVLSNSGYSYPAGTPGTDAAALEFESRQSEAPAPTR